jgi:hypothetical protein
MRVTYKQAKWLNSRGGMNINDVLKDKYGLYVLMGAGRGKEKKVYLPKDNEL